MFAYLKCGKSAAIYFELSKNLGKHPIFSINSCNEETIINIPYGQIIFTPPKRSVKNLKATRKRFEKQCKDAKDYDYDSKNIYAPPQRAAKNRSGVSATIRRMPSGNFDG